ncbi:MAG TPA: UDP-3-O-acyl-N-acetylglucosamine deacetylase [Phycisphaerales bacterium]|nr:UDP-3-O-acyl-N-acetylglucosamine deacetylase [Phycisphaerales bacterium]
MLTLALNPRTLARPVRLSGTGLFAPVRCALTIHPAPPCSGITLRRVDLPDQPIIRADARHVHTPFPEAARDAARHTVLLPAPGKTGVHTVEHLLSALWGLGITDAHAEVNGPEIPMLDASALPFALALRDAGVAGPSSSDTRCAEPIVVEEPIELTAGGARITASPSDGPTLELEYHLDYGPGAGPVLGAQSASFTLNWQCPDVSAYLSQVAPARTFCTQREADAFRAAGFFAHLGPGDVLIAGPQGPVATALRMRHEPAVHKVLDLLGDLALAGRPLFAKVTAHRSGHTLNHAMARPLMELG